MGQSGASIEVRQWQTSGSDRQTASGPRTDGCRGRLGGLPQDQSPPHPLERAQPMARQPEMAGRIQTGAIIFAALIEGAALFAIVVSFLIQGKFTF